MAKGAGYAVLLIALAVLITWLLEPVSDQAPVDILILILLVMAVAALFKK